MRAPRLTSSSFFFNDTATTEIYTLSLHDALPIYFHRILETQRITEVAIGVHPRPANRLRIDGVNGEPQRTEERVFRSLGRSEEHTSELQSHLNLVCRLLLKKKKTHHSHHFTSITQ